MLGTDSATDLKAIRSAGATRSKPKTDAIALPERRFAAGEIDRDEFEDRKRLLE